MEVRHERPPLCYPATVRALAGCFANTARLLWRHRLRLPARWVGTRLHFADGTSARVAGCDGPASTVRPGRARLDRAPVPGGDRACRRRTGR